MHMSVASILGGKKNTIAIIFSPLLSNMPTYTKVHVINHIYFKTFGICPMTTYYVIHIICYILASSIPSNHMLDLIFLNGSQFTSFEEGFEPNLINSLNAIYRYILVLYNEY
jgi:hypothetical protein